MKVRGFKARVKLSEEQLEHVERKPGPSLAPVLAVLVWVASMAAAAAIHFWWNSSDTSGSAEPPSELREASGSARARASSGAVDRAPERSLATPALAPADDAHEAPVTPASDPVPPVPSTAGDSGRRDRKIRGSYAGAGRDWLAGW